MVVVWQERLNLPANSLLVQSDRRVSDMQVHMRQRCVTEFLHAEKVAPIDIHQPLLNVDGDQARGCEYSEAVVVHFNSSNSGSPLVVHIFTSIAYRLSFTAGENV